LGADGKTRQRRQYPDDNVAYGLNVVREHVSSLTSLESRRAPLEGTEAVFTKITSVENGPIWAQEKITALYHGAVYHIALTCREVDIVKYEQICREISRSFRFSCR
jgi:hypothetical protein